MISVRFGTISGSKHREARHRFLIYNSYPYMLIVTVHFSDQLTLTSYRLAHEVTS